MDETRIRTLEDMGRFLSGTTEVTLKIYGGKDDAYAWIERTLVRFRYMWLGKKDRGLVLGYIRRLSGHTRQHVSKLVRQYRKTGHVRRRQRTVKGFETKYTKADIRLLADVDCLVGGASGTTVKTLCQRAFEAYGDQRFARLAGISVSHIYNLRQSKIYQRCRRKFDKTHGVKVEHWRTLQTQAQRRAWPPAGGFRAPRRYGWQERRLSHQCRG